MTLVVLCLGIFMIFLDTTIVNVAIPNIIDGIHAPLDQILWVLNSYLLAYGVLLITSGRLGDVFGPRNLFVLGLGVFSIASALCGLSHNGNQLIAARLFQGVGAALLTPQPLVIISRTFPADRRGMAFGIFTATGGLAAMAGPPAGGLIVTTWDWRWIFFVNVPVGGLAILLTFFLVPNVRAGRWLRMDFGGVALATAGLLAVIFGLIEGERFGWGAVFGPITIPEVIAAGLVLLVVFPIWETQQTEPLLPISLLSNRNFVIMTWLSGAVAFALFGMLLILTIDLQSVLSMSALQAGLTASPLTIATTLVSPLAGKLVDKVGGKLILIFGLTVAAIGIVDVAVVESARSNSFTFVVPATLIGVGMGFVFAPLITQALREVPAQLSGPAAGLLTTSRQVGSALGTAIVGAVLQNRLTIELQNQAVQLSVRLPVEVRQAFIAASVPPAHAGLQLGPGQLRAPALPAALAQVDQAQQLIRQVFLDAYVAAMRPGLIVAAAALLLGAFTCLWIRQPGRQPVSELQPGVASAVGRGR